MSWKMSWNFKFFFCPENKNFVCPGLNIWNSWSHLRRNVVRMTACLVCCSHVHQYVGDNLRRDDRTRSYLDAQLAHQRPGLVVRPRCAWRLLRHVQFHSDRRLHADGEVWTCQCTASAGHQEDADDTKDIRTLSTLAGWAEGRLSCINLRVNAPS